MTTIKRIEVSVPTNAIIVTNMDDAIAALEEMEEISAVIEQAQKRTVELKTEVTKWAVDKRVTVIQLDGHYYRQINRTNSGWDAVKLKRITSKISVQTKKGKKKLWNLITKRVPDPEKIDMAVNRGWISDAQVKKAFVATPQKPFLQKFLGEAAE